MTVPTARAAVLGIAVRQNISVARYVRGAGGWVCGAVEMGRVGVWSAEGSASEWGRGGDGAGVR